MCIKFFVLINYLLKACYGFIKFIRIDIRNNLIFIEITNASKIITILSFLKLHSRLLFLSLVDITAIDHISYKKNTFDARFQLVYTLLSHYFRGRIIVSVFLKENEDINSIFNLFRGSSWLEREIWDMFGIFFNNHPDLRRILTDYGFDGFPLRKDFPITGYLEVRYDDSQKCLVYESLELSQELRVFDTLSPWTSVVV